MTDTTTQPCGHVNNKRNKMKEEGTERPACSTGL